jgi:hypothetical protein
MYVAVVNIVHAKDDSISLKDTKTVENNNVIRTSRAKKSKIVELMTSSKITESKSNTTSSNRQRKGKEIKQVHSAANISKAIPHSPPLRSNSKNNKKPVRRFKC